MRDYQLCLSALKRLYFSFLVLSPYVNKRPLYICAHFLNLSIVKDLHNAFNLLLLGCMYVYVLFFPCSTTNLILEVYLSILSSFPSSHSSISIISLVYHFLPFHLWPEKNLLSLPAMAGKKCSLSPPAI